MSDFIEELRRSGLPVEDKNRPFRGVEEGRIKDAVSQLVPGETMAERAKLIGICTAQTLYNWSKDPGSVNRKKAEQLVDSTALIVKERWGLSKIEDARKVVLQSLAPIKMESAYNRGAQLILDHVYEYLFHDELYSLCELASTKVLYERSGQDLQPDLKAFLALADSWRRLNKKRQTWKSTATAEDIEGLQCAIEAFEHSISQRQEEAIELRKTLRALNDD